VADQADATQRASPGERESIRRALGRGRLNPGLLCGQEAAPGTERTDADDEDRSDGCAHWL
jgi:hypothetical protein